MRVCRQIILRSNDFKDPFSIFCKLFRLFHFMIRYLFWPQYKYNKSVLSWFDKIWHAFLDIWKRSFLLLIWSLLWRQMVFWKKAFQKLKRKFGYLTSFLCTVIVWCLKDFLWLLLTLERIQLDCILFIFGQNKSYFWQFFKNTNMIFTFLVF